MSQFPPRWIRYILALALCLTSSGSVVARQSSVEIPCAESVLAIAPLTPGSPLSDNIVAAFGLDGEPISHAGFEQPASVEPTGFPGIAYVRSLSGAYGLFDIENGTMTSVDFEDTGSSILSPNAQSIASPSGSRFALFADDSLSDIRIVDLPTGQTLALRELFAPTIRIIAAAISADDRLMVVDTIENAFVVNLAEPGPPVPIDTTARTSSPVVTEDSRAILAIRHSNEGSEIVRVTVDGSEIETLAAAKEWVGIKDFPGNILIGFTRDSVFRIFNEPGMAPVRLVESATNPDPLSLTSAGENLLIVSRLTDGSLKWHLTRLDGSSVADLSMLDGLNIHGAQQTADWALFSESLGPALGVPGRSYQLLDLRDGSVSIPLVQDRQATFIPPVESQQHGRYLLIQSIEPGLGRLWLVDGADNSATMISQYPGNASGAISPDGCHLAIGTFTTVGEGRQGQVEIREIATNTSLASIPNALLLGWALV